MTLSLDRIRRPPANHPLCEKRRGNKLAGQSLEPSQRPEKTERGIAAAALPRHYGFIRRPSLQTERLCQGITPTIAYNGINHWKITQQTPPP